MNVCLSRFFVWYLWMDMNKVKSPCKFVSLETNPPNKMPTSLCTHASLKKKSLLWSILIYHHPQSTTITCVPQTLLLCQGLTVYNWRWPLLENSGMRQHLKILPYCRLQLWSLLCQGLTVYNWRCPFRENSGMRQHLKILPYCRLQFWSTWTFHSPKLIGTLHCLR